MNEDIIDNCKRRGIESLIHFTRTVNLDFQKGLVPRAELPQEQMLANDRLRLDGQEHINLSIGEPNRRLLRAFQKRSAEPNRGVQGIPPVWVIIAISPEALRNVECSFTCRNAASKNEPRLTGLEGFRKLFASEEDSHPKNEQAECLVCGHIPVCYWKAIYVREKKDGDNLSRRMQKEGLECQPEILVKPELFS